MSKAEIDVYYKDVKVGVKSPEQAMARTQRYEAVWVSPNRIDVYPYIHTKTMKKEVKENSNYVCYICGQHISDESQLTVDHVVSRRYGGPLLPFNLKCCCSVCNGAKKAMSLSMFVYKLRKNPNRPHWATNERLDELMALYQEIKGQIEIAKQLAQPRPR